MRKMIALAFVMTFVAGSAFSQRGSTDAVTSPLRARDSVILARGHDAAIALLDSDDPTIRLVETSGGTVVVRLRIDDASRLIVLRGSEERLVRLRDVFADAALRKPQLTVEVLQGSGSVTVHATDLQPQAEGTIRRRAVVPPKPLPTSFALIDLAETSGAIDSETALLYRVYSLFGDARLPAQFRGDDSGILDSEYMSEVRRRFSMLSPATQAAVQPFLIPPAYTGSWANIKAASLVTVLDSPPPCSVFSDKWAFVDAVNTPVRIWYQVELADALLASELAVEVDQTIWPK